MNCVKFMVDEEKNRDEKKHSHLDFFVSGSLIPTSFRINAFISLLN